MTRRLVEQWLEDMYPTRTLFCLRSRLGRMGPITHVGNAQTLRFLIYSTQITADWLRHNSALEIFARIRGRAGRHRRHCKSRARRLRHVDAELLFTRRLRMSRAPTDEPRLLQASRVGASPSGQ